MTTRSPRRFHFGYRRLGFAILSMLAVVILALAILIFALPMAIALAHTALLRSEPAEGARLQQSPPRIAIWFDQELDASASTIGVFNAAGDAITGATGGVDLTNPDHASMSVSLPHALIPGHYLVRWNAVSAGDGHVGHATKGGFAFEIGD